MKRLGLIVIGFFIGFLAIAQSPTNNKVDRIVAVVGDKIILKSDIEIQYLQYAQQGNVPADFRCQILDQLLLQKMLLIQAQVDSIIVSPEEVESELDKRIRYFISLTGSQERLEEYYGKSVLEIKEEFRSEIRDQVLASRMQNKITGDVKVTPAEVRAFFNRIPTDSLPYFNAEVEVGQIVIYPKPNRVQRDAARQKLVDIRERIINGEDFGTMAILYSDDPGSAGERGELPEFGRTDGFVPEFVGASFRLKNPGDVSEVFETRFGYHIVQLIERKGERVKVRHILTTPRITSEDNRLARATLDSVRTMLLRNEITFAEAVRRFSEDEFTKNSGGMLMNQQTGDNFFELDQLGAFDRDLPFVIDTMSAGQFSKVIPYVDQQQKQAFRIVYLRSETEPHRANLKDDYARLQNVTLAEKRDKVMDEWLKSRIRKTYVRIDENYRSCNVINEWLIYNP